MTDAQPPAVRVAVEADDPRVAAGLRQLLATDPALIVTDAPGSGGADVVVVELSPAAGVAAGVRIGRLARSSAVVVLGFDDRLADVFAGLPGVTFLDKGGAGDQLLATVRSAGRRLPRC